MKNLIVVKGQQGSGKTKLSEQFKDAFVVDDAVRVNVHELKTSIETAYLSGRVNVICTTNHYHGGIDDFFRSIAKENEANFFVLTSKI